MNAPVETAAPDLSDPALFVNRELSWLAFNERVLDQARDSRWPLLERLKFLAIHGSNLDEFYMIRVSGLHEQLDAKALTKQADGIEVRELLAQIRKVAQKQLNEAARLYLDALVPELAAAGVRVRGYGDLSESEQRWARDYFRASVFPVLTPLGVDPVHPFPFLSNLSLSLAVELHDPASSEHRFARVKVPEILPRFAPIGDKLEEARDFVLMEELIGENLGELFPGLEIRGAHPFRVTRDMDLDVLEDAAEDLLSAVDRGVRQRRFGAAVRLEVSPQLSPHIRELLLDKLEIAEDDLYESQAPLGLSGLFQLSSQARAELRDTPLVQRVPSAWTDKADPFSAIRSADVCLHHPYDSFAPVLDLLAFAAVDPCVLAIKMTLYRAGSNAEAMRSLVRAAENGKQVAVSIELKARFDEANNIAWARALERAGAHVFYSAADVKTHAKALLIVRREGSDLRRYVHLSTGNYNAATSRLYTDFALMTCDPQIGEDVTELFNSLSGFSVSPRYQVLSVAPLSLRAKIADLVEQQAQRAREGKPARIFAKLNALVDADVIRSLYRASIDGVKIDLVVRGPCSLRPGVPGVSDNIRVRSLLGRFLEHERVFGFGPEGEEELYLASADWMPRNLDRRVELFFPITSDAIRKQILEECLLPLSHEDCGAYEMTTDGEYVRPPGSPEGPHADAQGHVMGLVARARPRPSLKPWDLPSGQALPPNS
ncbi:MAG TPA: polyphosphate kinase 1 [Polyangiaceae bacterium]|nr:polyphosphate kinase 1 [Polyangiaceae bacterium]